MQFVFLGGFQGLIVRIVMSRIFEVLEGLCASHVVIQINL